MIDTPTRVNMMTDEERIAFIKNLNVEDYRKIPGYWNEHLAEKIRQIHALQIEGGPAATSFGVIADFHFTVNALRSPALMEKILTDCSIPYFYMAGDIVSGMGMITPENLMMELSTIRRLFGRIESKMLITQGNHDPSYSTIPGAGYAQSLTREQIYESMFRFQTQYPNRVFSEYGTYFYADDPANKMRYIVLDTHATPNDDLRPDNRPVLCKMDYTGFTQTQLEWFANVALKVPSQEWTVVVCTHENLVINEYVMNRDLVLGIIDAFRRHTKFEGSTSFANANTKYTDPSYHAHISVDFTGAGGDFAVWVGGHMHFNLQEYINGILLLTTAGDSFNDIGTTNEQSFDIFTINKNTHRIHATHIGTGEDRDFTYEVFR